ncbi:MAG: tRNA nucleotidyltransferase, partial [Rikenellaceae bacterium]|nr:tRNA nucleotidyltransferase [Rikenellaceae bacterium]
MTTIPEALADPIFRQIGRIGDAAGRRLYVVGGYVRDYFLCRPNKDIDVVVAGSGVEIAQKLAIELRTNVSVFKTFGTAMLRAGDIEIEFVGARRESYSPDSRKPVVEDGTIEEDQLRRDFTINAM